MPSNAQVYGEWTRIYFEVLQKGYDAMPDWMKELPVEESAGILRGMMVEAGRCGLIPTAEELVERMNGEPCPEFKHADELAKPQEKPVEEKKPEPPLKKSNEEPPPSKPQENAYVATERQVAAIASWRKYSAYDALAVDYLKAHKAKAAKDLTITQASELLSLFDKKKNEAQGAK